MATTYSDPNLEEDIFDTSADAGSDIAVNTGDINRMPTTLPGSMFPVSYTHLTLPTILRV